MNPRITVESAVQRGLTKAKGEAFSLAVKADAAAHVVAFLDRYPQLVQRAQAGKALRDAVIASNARADSLAEACALQSLSRKLVPDERCPAPRETAEREAAKREAEQVFASQPEASAAELGRAAA